MSATLFAAWGNIVSALARAGVPEPSSYWRDEVRRFYLHATALLFVACIGRGGDKTRESVIMGLTETLGGDFPVPPGERHYFVHVTENVDEGKKTLAMYEAYLRILGVPFTRVGDTIELGELPRGIRVLACRVGAVSGYRCLGWTGDEAAKWSDDGVDPSAEVIASIRAMTVTHPNARGRIISSPLATAGYFYDTWKLGDTAEQIVAHAPTWVANPSVTEQQTRALERDARKWSREYAAIPAEAHDEALFDVHLVDRAQRAEPGDVPPWECDGPAVGAIDPSLGRNGFTFVLAAPRTIDGRTVASIVLHREWRAPRGQTLDLGAILAAIAGHCASYRCTTVLTDQFHGESLAALGEQMTLPITIVVDKPTSAERIARYEGTLVRLIDGQVELPRDPVVRSDLLAVRRRVTKGSDGWTIHMAVTSDGRHADFAPAAVLALERIAVEDAMPSWVTAMQTFAGTRPPTGRRPKPSECVVLTTEYATGLHTLSGRPPFAPHESATFRSGNPEIFFSEGAGESFRAAVQTYRDEHRI